jgi:hypothetical protein
MHPEHDAKTTNPTASPGRVKSAGLQLALGLILGTVFFLAWDAAHREDAQNSSSPSVDDASTEVRVPSSQSTDGHEDIKDTGRQQPSLAGGQLSHNQETRAQDDGAPPGSELWFVDPGLDTSLRFKNVPTTAIRWDPSCESHPFHGSATLEVLARDHLALEPSEYFLSDALPLQFTQFWSSSKRYHQLSLTWEQNTPQTFVTDAYVSDDPLMSMNVERTTLDGLPLGPGQLYSVVQEHLWQRLPAMISPNNSKPEDPKGTRLGARVALVRTSARAATSETVDHHFVELRNAQIITISNPQLNCRKSDSGPRALCTCMMTQR